MDEIAQRFEPPNPDERVSANFQFGGAVAVEFTLNSGDKTDQGFEERMNSLKASLSKVNDIDDKTIEVSRYSMAINSDELEIYTKTVKQLEDAGAGWKLHLNFDPNNETSVERVRETLGKMLEHGVFTHYKVGNGGGKAAGAPGKEATVYVGRRDKADLIAAFIDNELADVLLLPEGDTIKNDMPLAGKVMGRFDISRYDKTFNQYGPNGFPLLQYDSRGWPMLEILHSPDNALTRNRDYANLQEESMVTLQQRYGEFYTGTNKEELQPEVVDLRPEIRQADQSSWNTVNRVDF